MKTARRSACLFGSALGLVLAGCGGGSGGGSASSTPVIHFACVVNAGTAPSVTTYAVNATTGALGILGDSIDMTGKLPQWVATHPTNRVVYVTAFDNQVHAFAIQAATGALTEIDAEATGSKPTKAVVTPDGKYLYVTNSDPAAHSISVYSISTTDGTLTAQGSYDMLAGNNAWDIATEPESQYLYALDINHVPTAVLHAYTIGAHGALAEAPGSPSSPNGNVRSLATRLDQLYVNWYDDVVYQYTDQPVTLTPLAPPSVFTTGDGLYCTIVGDHFYRYVDWPVVNRGVYTFSIDAVGALTQMPGYLALTSSIVQITGGVDGQFLYSVDSNNDAVRWVPRNGTTGELGTPASKVTKNFPVCMTVLRSQ